MQSKTSFFNKTIFIRNLKRFWLLPAFYLFGLIWAMPVTLYFTTLNKNYRADGFLRLRENILTVYVIVGLVFAIGAGIVTAILLYKYMQHSASVSFFHSLPTNRLELFATNFISGFVMIFVPVIITCIITAIVAVGRGMNAVPDLLVWLLNMLVMVLFFFGFAVLCMIISGQSWFAGAVYTIFMAYVPGIIILINGIVSKLSIGYSTSLDLPDGVFGVISPASFFAIEIFNIPFVKDRYNIGISLSHMSLQLIEGSVFAVLFIIASYLLYKNRRSETAGDIVAYNTAKPVFRWGFAISFSILFTCLMINTIDVGRKGSYAVLYIFAILFGLTGFVLAQMMIKKNLHVIKGIRTELGIFACVMLVMALAITGYTKWQNKYVPNAEDVASVTINSIYVDSYEIIDRDVINEIVRVHQEAVDELEIITEFEDNGGNYLIEYPDSNMQESTYINIRYTIKKGSGTREVLRNYNAPANTKVYKHLESLYNDPVMMKKMLLGSVDPARIQRAYLFSMDDYETCMCTYGADARALYDACIRAIDQGIIGSDCIYTDTYINQIYRFENGWDYDTYIDEYKQPERKFTDKQVDFNTLSGFWDEDMRFILAFTMDEPDNGVYSFRRYYCITCDKDCIDIVNTMATCRWTY